MRTAQHQIPTMFVHAPPGSTVPECREPVVSDDDYSHYVEFVRTEYVDIAAFGAIRRAAEVARDCDRMGDKCVPYSVTHYDYVQRASEVRSAIRAAIGSDKE